MNKVFYFAILLFLSACSCCPYTFPGRRPPVMSGTPPCVLDYGAALDSEPDTFEICESEEDSREPLKPEFFDPYDPPVKEIRLEKGDVLEIYVYGEEETRYENVVIAPDGRLYYAFLDGIPASGRTISELTPDVERALEKYYKHPRVVLNLQNSSSMNWKILGKVMKPGVYPLLGPLTLRQAIGEAGGLETENYEFKATNSDLDTLADLKNSFIIRDNQKLAIDFKKLIHNATDAYDIYIKPGDYIYIASYEYREVYVLGNVRVPARLQYYSDMTLMQALATASGWLIGGPYAADVSNCIVIRGNLENPRVVKCDLCKIVRGEAKDFYLVPGDIIYLHNKTLRFARSLVRLAIDTFVQSFATTSGSYYADSVWFTVPIPSSTTSSTSSSTNSTQ